VAASDDGIMSVGLDRTILTWNAGAERMYGYTAEEIIGQPVTVLVPPDRAGEIDDMLQRLSLTLSPLRDAEGMIVGSASIVRDLTEWRRAEEELRQSEARYRSLARHFPNGTVTLFDHECRYQLTDGAGWTTATFNRDAMPGRTLREVFPPEIVDVAEPAYLDALAGNASRFTIVWNGVTHDVQVVPVRDDAGIVVGGLAMSQATDPNREAERISPDSLFC
jgi:PAS domain-containing protein